MNPVAAAQSYGYDPEEILEHLKHAMPQMKKMISKALNVGYPAAAVVEFLKNSLDQGSGRASKRPVSGKRISEWERLRGPGGGPREEEPGGGFLPAAGAIAGGALGAATGFGAIAGAIGGLAGGADLMKRYRKQQANGQGLGFSDFLAAAASGAFGAGLAKVAGAAMSKGHYGPPRKYGASPAAQQPPQLGQQKLLDSRSVLPQAKPGGGPGGAPSPSGVITVPPRAGQVGQPAPAMQGAAPIVPQGTAAAVPAVMSQQIQPEAASQQTPAIDERTLGLLKQFKLLDTIENTKNLSIEDAAGVIRTIVGPRRSKDYEKHLGKSWEEIIEGVRGHLESQQPAVGETQPQEPIAAEMQGKALPESIREAIPKMLEGGDIRKMSTKQIKGLASSNVSKAHWSPRTKEMHLLFLPSESDRKGGVYKYRNAPESLYKLINKGIAVAQTTGKSPWGAWFEGKFPSHGRAVHDMRKLTTEHGGDIEYEKIPEEQIKEIPGDIRRQRDVDLVRKLAIKTSPTKEIHEATVARQEATGRKVAAQSLKLEDDVLIQLDDDEVAAFMEATRAEMKGKRIKGAPAGSPERQQVFKEKVIEKAKGKYGL